MGTMTSQITSLAIVYSTVYSGVVQRKHQSSASLAFVGNSPVNSQHKWPVTRKRFPFDDVVMATVVGRLPDLRRGRFLNFMVNMGYGVIGVHNNFQIANRLLGSYAGRSHHTLVHMYRWTKFWADYQHFSWRDLAFCASAKHGSNRSKFHYLKLSGLCQILR